MTKFFATLIVTTCLATIAGHALATSTNPVMLTGIEIDATGGVDEKPKTFIQFGTTMPNGRPRCATATWMVLDPNLSIDNLKALTSIATSAYLAGKTVRVNLLSTCSGSSGIINDIVMTSGN